VRSTEFDEQDWIARVKKVKTGEELNALAMEIPEDYESGRITKKQGHESTTTAPPIAPPRSPSPLPR